MLAFLLKASLFFIFLSCHPAPQPTELSDEYVLIEFAAKLEEEQIQLYPEPLDKVEKNSLE